MQRSPRDDYRDACLAMRTRINSGVLAVLPAHDDGYDSTLSLDFSRNCLGRNGLAPLLPVLQRCEELRILNLGDNYLSNDSVIALCDILGGLKQLHTLRLDHNPISYAAGKRLEACIEHCPSLVTVDVSVTLMNPGLAKRVAMAASRKAIAAGAVITVDMGCADGAAAGSERNDSQWLSNRPTRSGWLSALSPTALSQQGTASNSSAHAPRGDGHGSPLMPTKLPSARAVAPDHRWYAMETIWAVAADAAGGPADGSGYPGLLSVLSHTRSYEAAGETAA
jgi:hypothetical protein